MLFDQICGTLHVRDLVLSVLDLFQPDDFTFFYPYLCSVHEDDVIVACVQQVSEVIEGSSRFTFYARRSTCRRRSEGDRPAQSSPCSEVQLAPRVQPLDRAA